ncbi:hypothetical protein JCM8208_002264 [Rhodotorula glutinis]
MLHRSLAQSARSAARPFASSPARISAPPRLARGYAEPAPTGQSKATSETSGPHQTIPHAPPKPTPFFARKNIGLEVTPLMAFIGTIVTVATGFLVKNLITDDSIQHRHGVDNDEGLNKVLNSDGRDPNVPQSKQ